MLVQRNHTLKRKASFCETQRQRDNTPLPLLKTLILQKLVQDELRQVLDKPEDAADTVRLVLHDAGTFDLASGTGGLNGSIRFRSACKCWKHIIGSVPDSLSFYFTTRIYKEFDVKENIKAICVSHQCTETFLQLLIREPALPF